MINLRQMLKVENNFCSLMKEKFSCPNCGIRLPFSYVFKIKNDHVFACPCCKQGLKPLKTKSWNWGFAIGFLVVVIPTKLYLSFRDDIVGALAIGAFTGLLSVLAIGLYLYASTTLLKE